MPPFRIFATVAPLALVAGCATYDDRGYGGSDGYPSYQGGQYGGTGVGGTGARDLDPWLGGSRAGQALVLARFDRNDNGEIGSDRAREANAWFRRYADRDHDLRLTDREIDAGLQRVARELRQR